MNNKIGETAGRIWNVLSDGNESTPAKLKKEVNADDKLLWMAIGWLLREDKLVVKQSGNSYKISLSQQEFSPPIHR